MRFKALLMAFLLICGSAYADIASPDHTFVQNDTFSSDFHTRLNEDIVELTNSVNNIDDSQMKADTLLERSFADEINPRVRTAEGASCEFVHSGLLPSTDSDLTSDISAGTAYPLGYRINKASATAHTYTASKWTYVDIDINGDFQYQEQTIDGSAPAVASNSIRLARVSTDSTQIVAVSDLRTTSCTSGPFEAISDVSGEATLEDILANGAHVRQFSHAGRTPVGYVGGLIVSWDTHTTFKVTKGAAYINGKYRFSSSDITVPQTADSPSTGVSGLDTGSVGTSARHCIYAIADQDSVPSYSVSFSQSCSSPTGITNYRLIGSIATDASGLFTSQDVTTAHAIGAREVVGGWARFNTSSSTTLTRGYNVSGLTDQGTGDTTVTWDFDFEGSGGDELYSCVCSSALDCSISGMAPGTCRVLTDDLGGATPTDTARVTVIAIGDQTR